MQIRTQLIAAISACIAVGLVAAMLIGRAAGDEDLASELQARAQTASHEVSGLLVLTQEYARYAEDRSAQQWHQRHGAIAATLRADAATANDSVALHEFRAVTRSLPQLFSRLEELPQTGDDFTRRRKEALIDQLLTNTQAMSDFTYQWYQDASQKRARAERQFQVLAIATPLLILALLVVLALGVRRRVLAPLSVLQAATARVAKGDLSAHIGSERKDEFGDLARRFDEMTAALTRSNEQMLRSQRQLRAVSDSMPAFVAYVDKNLVYRFTNAYYATAFGIDPDSLVGQPMGQRPGVDAHDDLKDELAGVLRGERRRFERQRFHRGTEVHLLVHYTPDFASDGSVAGFYVLANDITARKEAEMAQARSEQMLRLIADNLPTLIAYVDPDEQFRFANGHYERLLGVSPEVMLGKTVACALGELTRVAVSRHLAAGLAGERQQFERTFTRDGHAKHLLVDYIPDVAADGTVNGLFTMAVDITMQKELQLAHARGEEQLRVITDNLPALIAHFDADQRYTFANAAVRKSTGLTQQQIIGKTLQEVRSAEYPDLAAHVEAALLGESCHFEGMSPHPDGNRYYSSTYIPDADGLSGPPGFYAMTLDITPRKQAELLQAQSEQRVRSILTHAPDAFISIDSKSRIQEWNRQAELTFGWTRAEVLGRPLSQTLIPPEHRASHDHDIQRFASTGSGPMVNQRIEITALHKDGRTIPIELSVAAVNEGSGFAANAFLRDITERKQAENQLRDSERRLRDITDNIPAMIGYFDSDERCVFANSTVLRLNGIKNNETGLHTLRSGIGEEAYALHEPHVRRALAGEMTSFEGHVIRKGRDAYFQAHLVPDIGTEGAVRGFYVMSFDVTPVRQAEIDRTRSERLLRNITDNLPVLISYIDSEQRVRFANETYRGWLGADPAKLIGMHVRDVVGEVLYEPRRVYVERALAGERVDFENEALALGILRTTHTSYIPDLDPDGAVRGIYTLSSDVTALKQVEKQLKALARVDSLTGLANRLQFNERLPESLARAARSRRLLAVMFLDIDRFKSINDSLGHAAGDDVLKEFAHRLLQCVRSTDTVARLAGDEFVIILEGLNQDDEALAVAAKIISAVNLPMHTDAGRVDVSTSIGIAFHHASAKTPPAADLLSTADAALYAAKDAGRNTFRVAYPPSQEKG
jgi:diguanylate cyclase (GGDEF)-like protein/PAS domain S-box-containing protein